METKVVRITKAVYEKAIERKIEEGKGEVMDDCSWLSYLIKKGLEKEK